MKCNWISKEVLAMDEVFYVDGRLTGFNLINEAQKIKERYKKNFPHKYKSMVKFECKKGVFYVWWIYKNGIK